jgi:mRNA-degrading endonuclease RelE of RelBE toxin-antitoxin system
MVRSAERRDRQAGAFEIVLAPGAVEELRSLPGDVRSGVRDAIELHLRHEPTKVSRSRIKRLRGLERPQYRLRVGEVRVFYDVTESAVEVLAIISKAAAQAWLDEKGLAAPPGGPGGSKG